MSKPNNELMNIFHHFQYRELKVIDVDGGQKNKKFHSEIKSRNEIICCGENADVMPEQTTLVSISKKNLVHIFFSFGLKSKINGYLLIDLFIIAKSATSECRTIEICKSSMFKSVKSHSLRCRY